MNITVSPINFRANKNSQLSKSSESNPISRKGETANLVKATFAAGFGLGAKLLFELLDDEFLFEHAGNIAGEIVDRNKSNASALKKVLCKAGGTLGLLVAAVSAFAILYTVFKSPKIAYEAKINTFKKGNEMDVFIKQNKAQKGIYEQLNKEAQEGNNKEKLKEQYLNMQMAKTKRPDFIRNN